MTIQIFMYLTFWVLFLSRELQKKKI